MNVIMMEKSDYDRLVGQIEEIAEHIRKNDRAKAPGTEDRWISNREAMDILGVSSRTLQRYRDTGRIPFFKIQKKLVFLFHHSKHIQCTRLMKQ